MNTLVFQALLSLKEGSLDAEGMLSRMVETNGERRPPIASFYRALKKALDSGYLEIVGAAAAGARGRPGQRYRITRAGKTALEAEARRLGRLARLALSDLELR